MGGYIRYVVSVLPDKTKKVSYKTVFQKKCLTCVLGYGSGVFLISGVLQDKKTEIGPKL